MKDIAFHVHQEGFRQLKTVPRLRFAPLGMTFDGCSSYIYSVSVLRSPVKTNLLINADRGLQTAQPIRKLKRPPGRIQTGVRERRFGRRQGTRELVRVDLSGRPVHFLVSAPFGGMAERFVGEFFGHVPDPHGLQVWLARDRGVEHHADLMAAH